MPKMRAPTALVSTETRAAMTVHGHGSWLYLMYYNPRTSAHSFRYWHAIFERFANVVKYLCLLYFVIINIVLYIYISPATLCRIRIHYYSVKDLISVLSFSCLVFVK